ncbi:ScbR family autoregulator-binding transcription factor [Kitasatospora misakiensis]|uniref:ScbR family autoregulator-binding transcription factor n=1 Tax=Kitasatospora misakiensis TaxID=67330 RepID=A0ABW0X5R1_9ACTN
MARAKQERAVRTRETILRAAAQIFDEYGFSGSSVSKIINQAGTTQGAMYFHFKSKEDLARAVMNEQASDLDLPERPAGLRQLIDLNLYLADELQGNVLLRAGVTLAVEQGQLGLRDFSPYEMWAEQFRAELEAARRAGELLDDVAIEELSQVLVAAYTGSQIMSHLRTGRADLPERIAQLWWFLLPGMATAPVVAELRAFLAEQGTEHGGMQAAGQGTKQAAGHGVMQGMRSA